MNWADVGAKIVQYAPLAGAALSSPFGAVAAAGTLIAKALGVSDSPDDVMKYITQNPEEARKQLRDEMAANIELEKLCLEITKENNRNEESVMSLSNENTEGARKNLAVVVQSPVDNAIRLILVISQVIILGACVFIMAKFGKVLDQSVVLALGTVMGSMATMLGNKDNFYWGSSDSSRKKDDVIAMHSN